MLLLSAAVAGALPAVPDSGRGVDRWLARDKTAHFALSCALVGFEYHLGTRENGAGRPAARNISVAVTVSLGVAKEAWDGTRNGNHFSWRDLAADILGTACGVILFTRR